MTRPTTPDGHAFRAGQHRLAPGTAYGPAPDSAAGDGETRAIVAPGARAQLDEVAKRIIEQLQEDGRRPYATISKAVGLSEAAVRQRVQRLLDSGVVQIVAVTDPLQLGFPRQAMIGIRTSGDLESIADRLAELDEVDYVVITAGSFDLLTEVVCRNDDHLLDTLQRIRAVEGIVSTEAFVYLKLRKQTYTWGTA
jgi:Lrp/AsnC family transcriptional regulator for asnA, asnC and gidA